MNLLARILITLGSACLCLAGVFLADFSVAFQAGDPLSVSFPDRHDNAYQRILSDDSVRLNFNKIESVIRQHRLSLSPGDRIEFGSLKVDGDTASVQVVSFGRSGGMTPYLYVLKPENNSWRIMRVQRLWFVPPSRILRGLQV